MNSRFMNSQTRSPQVSYRAAAVAGASPVRLVSLLYEQLIEDLQRAAAAQCKRDIAERTRQINHAILVLGYLQTSLDKTRGGAVAVTLERFYEQLRAGLVEAQFRQSVRILEQQICDLMQVNDAWREVERATMAQATMARTTMARTTMAQTSIEEAAVERVSIEQVSIEQATTGATTESPTMRQVTMGQAMIGQSTTIAKAPQPDQPMQSSAGWRA